MSESVCYESQSLHPRVREICVMAASEMIAMMKVRAGRMTAFSITEEQSSQVYFPPDKYYISVFHGVALNAL